MFSIPNDVVCNAIAPFFLAVNAAMAIVLQRWKNISIAEAIYFHR